MSDDGLRELRRRCAQTNAVEDQAAMLREEVRLGLVPTSSLDLAAHLGHPAARLVAGDRPPVRKDIAEFVASVQRVGGSAACLQGLCLALLEIGAPGAEVSAAVELARRWVEATPTARETLEDEVRRTLPGHDGVQAVPPLTTLHAAIAALPAEAGAALALRIAVAMPWGEDRDRARHVVAWCSHSLALVVDAVAGPGRMAASLRRPVPPALRAAVTERLAAWSLVPSS